MAWLEQACARLEASVERLAQSIEAGPRGQMLDRVQALESELETLRVEHAELSAAVERLTAERDRLTSMISETQERYAAARVVGDAVARRLSQAITDMRALVGG